MDRLTYIIDIVNLDWTWNNFEKRTKYEIRKCTQKVRESDEIEWFNQLHKQTRPDRYISDKFIPAVYRKYKPNIVLLRTDTAGAVIAWDVSCGYYLFAARDKTKRDGSPSLLLWSAMKFLNKIGISQFDLCGANNPDIAKFKRGFGGELAEEQIRVSQIL